MVGRDAPPLALVPLAGSETPTDADLRTADAKIVNFWASWCLPCRAEHPHLMALSDSGIEIYGVNYKDDPLDAAGFLEELGNPFTKIGADRSGRAAIDWGVYGVPETFVVDRNGTVLLRHPGPVTSRVLGEKILPAIADSVGG